MQSQPIVRPPAESRIRGQIRKAMNAYMDAPTPAKWARIMRLDAQLRKVTGAAR